MSEIGSTIREQTPLQHSERGVISTERPGDFYLSLFNLKEDDLIGQILLNLGAGGSDLQADFKTKGLKVFNIDPSYNGGNHRGIKNSTPIAGSALTLPLADNSVDISTSLWSTGYVPDKYSQLYLTEMIRVTSGKSMLYPCSVGSLAEDFLKQNNLESIFKIETPALDLKLLLANLHISQGFFGNLTRLIKNSYYVKVESDARRVAHPRRLTINSHELKKNPEWQAVTMKLIESGLTLDI
ncbi:MAG: methyltransferase domain-containing protein [bacterium]